MAGTEFSNYLERQAWKV